MDLAHILQEPLAALACAQVKAAGDVVSYNATMDSCVLGKKCLMIVSTGKMML